MCQRQQKFRQTKTEEFNKTCFSFNRSWIKFMLKSSKLAKLSRNMMDFSFKTLKRKNSEFKLTRASVKM